MTKTGGRSIEIQINGKVATLCTIGHVARVLRRTTWTVKYWEAIGLLPPAPYILNPEVPRTRRRLYLAEYIEALGVIADRGYLGRRLDRDEWRRFHDDAFMAYQQTVTPFTNRGVMSESECSAVADDGGQPLITLT
jgi:hypothetical protein